MTRSAIYAHAGALWQAMRADYDLALEAHIDAADRACRGQLLTAAAIRAGVTVDRLFRMNVLS